MTAAGLQILISVLKYVFGVTVPSYTGPLAIVYVSGGSARPPSPHPATPARETGPGEQGRVQGRGVPAPAQPGCCVPHPELWERGFNEE